MIKPDYDANGNRLEFEPAGRLRGTVRTFTCTCDQCGKQYHLPKIVKLENKKCSCLIDSDKFLTIGETSLTLDKWVERFPELNLGSIKVRLSHRNKGKRNCSDEEILWGYNKTSGGAPRIQFTNENLKWKITLVSELNKRLHRMKLMDAIIEAVYYACKESDFGTLEKEVAIFTTAGLDFKFEGQGLIELYAILDDSILELRKYLREEAGLNDTQIDKLLT